MILGFAGMGAYGLLQNNTVTIDMQSFDVMNSVEEFSGGFSCACSDPNGILPGFNIGFCNVDDNDPNSLGPVGNMLCTWETNGGDYGGLLQEWDEGCKPNDWLKLSKGGGLYQWPAGYKPDYYFDDIFLITLADHTDDNKKYGTLENALKNKVSVPGKMGNSNNFEKEATTALLNPAHFEINYPYTISEVIKMTQDASTPQDQMQLWKEFKTYNKAGDDYICPKK